MESPNGNDGFYSYHDYNMFRPLVRFAELIYVYAEIFPAIPPNF